MKIVTLIIVLGLFSSPIFASKGMKDSRNMAQSTIKDNKHMVQSSMKKYVNAQIQANGFMPAIHKGKVLKLTVLKSKKYPDGFHSGVKNKGKLYTSCADFKDSKGNTYDVDFLVSKVKSKYMVVQPIVHSINGEKNPYDLKH